MFGNLFAEEEDEDKPVGMEPFGQASRRYAPSKGTGPPAPRQASRLCGILNQGATCYLNALLQTLHHTPEFREAIFSLKPEELGSLEDKDNAGSKVRVIPLQLQRIFSTLLLLDQEAASTTSLTDSFGWTDNQELHQHDVQELNRILCGAIESSLVGTSGSDLIDRLYRGTIRDIIECCECGNVRELEEPFFDLMLSVCGADSLEEALSSCFQHVELMEGANCYHCTVCARLVAATKESKLRSLPPFLTLSLLRFNFDAVKCKRYKETGPFTFPLHLHTGPYCEVAKESEEFEYDLYSVIVHKGGCYGGHYHAFIRDIDGLGVWSSTKQEEIVKKKESNLGPFPELDPVEFCKLVICQAGPHGLTMEAMCKTMQEVMGVSWKKKYRKQHGTLTKFLQAHPDVFIFNKDVHWISLREPGDSGNAGTINGSCLMAEECYRQNLRPHRAGSAEPLDQPNNNVFSVEDVWPVGGWFDFDDSQVRPISERELEQQFEGKESAYMLFYRKSTLKRPVEAFGNPWYKVPQNLTDEVDEINDNLLKRRHNHELQLNSINVSVHLSPHYELRDGGLQARSPEGDAALTMVLDRRMSVAQLKSELLQLLGSWMGHFEVGLAKHLPAGLHVYPGLCGDEQRTLVDCGIEDGCSLFVWDGQKVQGKTIPTGVDNEPVLLNLHRMSVVQPECRAFRKNMTLRQLRCSLARDMGVTAGALRISRGWPKVQVELTSRQDSETLRGLSLIDGDSLGLVVRGAKGDMVLAHTQTVMPGTLWIRVVDGLEDCSTKEGAGEAMVPFQEDTVRRCKKNPISTIKASAINKLQLDTNISDTCCLRVDAGTGLLLTPLSEEERAEEANLRNGCTLVLKDGVAPTADQLFLHFTIGSTLGSELEMIVDKSCSVRECLRLVLDKAGLTGCEWHLCRVSLCGQTQGPLQDEDITLEHLHICSGDHLHVMEGKLIPKGFLRLSVWLMEDGMRQESDKHADIQGVMGYEKLTKLEEVQISCQASLDDLKLQVMTLLDMEQIRVQSLFRLRLWLLEGKHYSRILQNSQKQLKKLGLCSNSQIGVQLLDKEETLRPTDMVLRLRRHIPGLRIYTKTEDLVFDTAQDCTARSLLLSVAMHVKLSAEQLLIAKHFPTTHEWLIIEDAPQARKIKKKRAKQNLRQFPYHLKNGDVIGVKNKQTDPSPDFSSFEDDMQREQIKTMAEQQRRQSASKDMSTPRSPRPEVPLSISVADFR
uniref:ubiquitin carboxyl-terminal hydrolase 40 isoform X2 n=1 Tax=Myxine glutinosa TaxID=7769 RepID=UPI0035900788